MQGVWFKRFIGNNYQLGKTDYSRVIGVVK
jgi:hypothetical protein